MRSSSPTSTILITNSISPLLNRVLFLFPSLHLHTPCWVYDQIKGISNELLPVYGIPQFPVCLRDMRCRILYPDNPHGAKCIVEQTGALVIPDVCNDLLVTHIVSDRWLVNVTMPVVHLQWFLDCLQTGERKEISKYLLSPTPLN